MIRRQWTNCVMASVALVVSGCGARKSGDANAHGGEHDRSEGTGGVAFKAGLGLRLAPETAKALGVVTADVSERALAHRIEVLASVFKSGPPARAMVRVSPELAAELEQHPPSEAKIVSFSRALTAATGQVEITVELPRGARVGETLSLILTGKPANVTAVPTSAILRSATGTFVYVENSGSLLRTAVKTGASDGAFTAITDGLYAGDVVAVAAVEQLWLTELRLTKGGGHSH